MADSVLSKLVQTDKETKKHLESLDSTVQSIYGLQKKVAKMEETERKRAARDAKRKKADSGIDGLIKALKKQEADKKKDTKKDGNLLQKMTAFFTGGALVKALTSGLSGIAKGIVGGKIIGGLFGKKGIFGKKGLLAKVFGKKGLIATGLNKIFGKGAIGKLFKGANLMKGLKMGGIFTGLISGVVTYFESGDWLKAVTTGLGAGGGSVVGGLLGSIFGPIGTVAGAAIGGIIGDWLGKYVYEKFPGFFEPIKKIGDDIGNFLVGVWEWMKPFFEGFMDGLKEFWGQLQTTFKLLKRIGDRLMNEVIKPLMTGLGDMWNTIKTTLAPAVDFLSGMFQKLGDFLGSTFGWMFTDESKKKAGEAQMGPANFALGLLNKALGFLAGPDPEGKQTGGVINVPGTGSGDKVPAMLAPGSFVMNRNAVGGFQRGGIPAMLEPGEQVYSPGSWGPMHMMMNSAIPRFQSGGLVQTSHTDTGEGYSVGKDAQGRPAIFSQGGAEAFMQMMKASDGQVSPGDVNSSQRSPSKNAAVGGAANSNHLYGNGVDVQTGSPSWTWMKANSSKYGWHWNNYLGADGWHWDYTGKNSNTNVPNQGSESGIKATNKQGLTDWITGKLGGFGGAAGFAAEALGAIVSGLGSGLASALGLSFATASSASPGSDNTGGKAVATPVTGGAKGLLDFIASYESGGDYNKIFGGSSIPGLTDMTINQVVAEQNKHLKKGFESAAIGRYQMMYPEVYAQKAGLDPATAKFSQANQDKMAMVYLNEDGYQEFKSGKMTANQFANNVAGTWAAMPTSSGRSAHAGVGSNASLVDRSTFMEHIRASKMQTGGITNMSGAITPSSARYQRAQEEFAQSIAEAAAPIIVPMPSGAPSGAGGQIASATNQPPSLPNGPSSVQSAEYFYRLNLGSAF